MISAYGSQHEIRSTRFWIESESVDENSFDTKVPIQSLYRKAIGENYRINYVYKDSEGKNQYFQFDQGSLAEKGGIFYYTNDVLTFMDNDSININYIHFPTVNFNT
ncbi:hypothetical protein [Galbibacter sp.]|uniref:hypothetical protein n=1 Tax=Galbibacter sp. TaxID=2918471 RepID=UPI003A8DF8A8